MRFITFFSLSLWFGRFSGCCFFSSFFGSVPTEWIFSFAYQPKIAVCVNVREKLLNFSKTAAARYQTTTNKRIKNSLMQTKILAIENYATLLDWKKSAPDKNQLGFFFSLCLYGEMPLWKINLNELRSEHEYLTIFGFFSRKFETHIFSLANYFWPGIFSICCRNK